MASQLPLEDLIARVKAFTENPEKKAFIARYLLERSGKDGKCIKEGCNGHIVKRIRGATSFDYIYSVPYCETCRQEYLFAPSNIPIVGQKSFNELMNTSYGI
ncbi:MAG: hypothetical protein PHH40_00965 [Candidatus Moranbacteria bacterium]|nr:hypothetical protein [Candidatus Moranbacteria bacterium]MDD3964885.1 hypothetical protein [Candidatus Moranbacteria bacterium]